jgi:hypothetical protein
MTTDITFHGSTRVAHVLWIFGALFTLIVIVTLLRLRSLYLRLDESGLENGAANAALLSFPSFFLPAPARQDGAHAGVRARRLTCELLVSHAALDRILLVRVEQALLLQRQEQLVDVADELAALVLQ